MARFVSPARPMARAAMLGIALGAALAAIAPPAGPAAAQSLLAARALPARTVINAGDLQIADKVLPGVLAHPADAVGLETRVTIYAGRPIRAGDLVPPALIERNDVVKLRVRIGGLLIETDGRALDRAGLGERVRVMNLSSRNIVTGRVDEDRSVEVSR